MKLNSRYAERIIYTNHLRNIVISSQHVRYVYELFLPGCSSHEGLCVFQIDIEIFHVFTTTIVLVFLNIHNIYIKNLV